MLKRKMKPIHPGEILREEIIYANNLTVAHAAKLLKVTRQTLSNIINKKSDLSPEMCLRIAYVFGGTPEIWSRMQIKYSLYKAEQKISKIKFSYYKNNEVSL